MRIKHTIYVIKTGSPCGTITSPSNLNSIGKINIKGTTNIKNKANI